MLYPTRTSAGLACALGKGGMMQPGQTLLSVSDVVMPHDLVPDDVGAGEVGTHGLLAGSSVSEMAVPHLPKSHRTVPQFAMPAFAATNFAQPVNAESVEVELGDADAGEMVARLTQMIGQRAYDVWFRNKSEFSTTEDELTIRVSSPFLLKWLQKQFKGAALQAAQGVLGPSARVRFEVDGRIAGAGAEHAETVGIATAASTSATTTVSAAYRTLPPVQTQGIPAGAGELSNALVPILKSVDMKVAESKTIELQRKNVRVEGVPLRVANTAPSNVSGRTNSSGREALKPRAGRRFADLADFAAGACNELALTAARQVCEAPGQRFNPLFIAGPVGTGKTHLLEGIYRQLRRNHPTLNVVFLTAEAFANYFTQALREHTLPSFRQRFRTVDVLLVDDVNFLDAKRVIQEEFLHTFKQLESHGRQIVVTADRHPRLLSKVSEDLKTRFLSGMVCRLDPPDAATREKIVQLKSDKMQANFSPEALQLVAQRFTNNVRELEGALNCLQTYHTMTGKRIGSTAARQVLSDLERDCVRVVRLADIERVICQAFGVEEQELKSSRRTRSLSQPRMLAMYLARKHTSAAYSEIGQYFGGRNHSTVISAERKIHASLTDSTPVRIASQLWKLGDLVESLEQQLVAG